MNDLLKRSVTAFFFAIVMLGGICWSENSFIILLAVINAVSVWEFSQLSGKSLQQDKNVLLVNSIINSCVATLLFFEFVAWYFDNKFSISMPAVVLLTPVFYMVKEVLMKKSNSIMNAGSSMLGFFYVTVPMILLVFMLDGLSDFETGYAFDETYPVLMILFLIWTNDTMAYFSGRMFGKNKLYESLSPKKTWEGFFGGMIFTIIVAFVLQHFNFIRKDTIDAVMIGLLVSIFGTVGDLFESMMKRQAGVKDSGIILPGHGGLLDRFDAFLLAIPFVFVYEILRPLHSMM